MLATVVIGSTAWGQGVETATWGRRGTAPPVNCPPGIPLTPGYPSGPLSPNAPPTNPNAPPTDPNAAQPPSTDAFAQAGEGGTLPSAPFAPAFFGDLVGYSGNRVVTDPHGNTSMVRVPLLARSGGYKVAEYESPRPVNRVFYAFNYYNDVNQAVNPGLPGIGLYRHTIGFEKTFLDGDASFGMRLPFVRVSGTNGADENRFSDLSLIFKYALYNDRTTGDVLSGGLVLTVPTGGGITIDYPNPQTGVVDGSNPATFYSVIFQPFAGWVRNVNDRLYLHGFHSFAVPTDARDVTLLFNDVGIGYWLYRNQADRFVQAVIPTLEFHLNTPLTHRGLQSTPIGFADQLNLTFGTYVMFPRSTLGIAAGIPLVGPKPYDVETAINFTFRF